MERLTIRLIDPKGGKSVHLPLSEAAAEVLVNLPRAHELVFPGRNGKRRHDIKRPLARIRKAAGLPPAFVPFMDFGTISPANWLVLEKLTYTLFNA